MRTLRDNVARMQQMFPVIGEVAGFFKYIETAERVIAELKEEHPDMKGSIDRVFKHACPSPLIRRLSLRMYEEHVRELASRAAFDAFADLAEPTDIECIAVLAYSSLKAPPTAQYGTFYEHLFFKRFGAPASKPDEPWSGAWAEARAEVVSVIKRTCPRGDVQ